MSPVKLARTRARRASFSTACRRLSLIEKRDGKYSLTPTAEIFLVKGKPSYCGDFRHVALALWDGMAHLKESLKTGKPLSRMDTNAELQVWEKLVLGIIVIAEPAAKALCDILKIGRSAKVCACSISPVARVSLA